MNPHKIIHQVLQERFGEPIELTIGVKHDTNENTCCDSCGMMSTEIDQAHSCNMLDEKTPLGGEKMVKALKKNKNPWVVAWNSYNKKHDK